MGNISVNKLGGISLIVGPVLALIFYLIGPGADWAQGPIGPKGRRAHVGPGAPRRRRRRRRRWPNG